MELKANEFIINIFKTISSIIMCPFILIMILISGFIEIGAEFFDDIIIYLKDRK